MFDTRASLPNEVRADIEHFLASARGTNCAWAQAQILPTFIRRNIKLAEAPSYGQTIFEYERNCHGAEDYMKVAESIHAQYQPADQLGSQDDIGEMEEGREGQTKEPSAVESVQEESMAASADAPHGPDALTEHEVEKPPIEIKAIPQPDVQAPSSELTQATPPEAEQTQTE